MMASYYGVWAIVTGGICAVALLFGIVVFEVSDRIARRKREAEAKAEAEAEAEAERAREQQRLIQRFTGGRVV